MDLIASESRFKKGQKPPKKGEGKTKTKEKASGYNRSKLLKLIMPLISGTNGDNLIAGLNDRDPDKVREVMQIVGKAVIKAAKPNTEKAKSKE